MICKANIFIQKNFIQMVQAHINGQDCNRSYVQFRGSEFHTRNARSRQLQEQRRAKAG